MPRPGAAALLELFVGVSGPGLCRDVPGELLFVEAGVVPGDVPVVHLVRDAEVPEAAEEVLLDALDEVAAVDEVLLAQGEEVAPVGPSETEQELRPESGEWDLRRPRLGPHSMAVRLGVRERARRKLRVNFDKGTIRSRKSNG
jgi:hypothetical protein